MISQFFILFREGAAHEQPDMPRRPSARIAEAAALVEQAAERKE
jgi:hypothetical protein